MLELPAEMMVASMTALKMWGRTRVPELVIEIKNGEEEMKFVVDANAGSL